LDRCDESKSKNKHKNFCLTIRKTFSCVNIKNLYYYFFDILKLLI